VALSALCCIGCGSAGAAEAAASNALSSALEAPGPHASLGDQAQLLGRLVGAWDVEYGDVGKDGTVKHRTGRLIVGWVMDGRAIQDLWVVEPSGGRTEREVYADLRYFDPKTRTWPATFIDPEHASSARFTAIATQTDRIELHTPDLGAADSRWSFTELSPTAVVFRDESSDDGGKTWRLRSEDHLTRRGPVPPPR
jgi:hypothetical protein